MYHCILYVCVVIREFRTIFCCLKMKGYRCVRTYHIFFVKNDISIFEALASNVFFCNCGSFKNDFILLYN